MTAPAAPIIFGHFDGFKVRLRWRPVPNATDYKVYVGGTTNPAGLQDDINFVEQGTDGWFHFTYRVDESPLFIAATALNITAEESARSNELRVVFDGNSPGSFPPVPPRQGRTPFG
jgi:hypothetical protein